MADSFRVADDMGKLRCQLKYFNKPLFGWKGSYVICNVRTGHFKQFFSSCSRPGQRGKSLLTGGQMDQRPRIVFLGSWPWTRGTPSTSSRGRCTRSLLSHSKIFSNRESGGCRASTWFAGRNSRHGLQVIIVDMVCR